MASDAKSATSFEEGLKGASEKVAEFHEEKSALKRLQHWLHQTPSAVPMIVLVVALIIFGVLSENFFKATTLSTILQQIAIVGIIGCAQSLVVLTAGIDLSVGAIAVFSSVLMGQFTFRYGIPAPLAIGLGLALGTLMGFVNGWLVAKVKLPPFIVTLGTWNIIMAICLIYSENATMREADVTALTQWLHVFAINFRIGPAVVTLGVVAMILLYIALWFMLNHTAFGRHIYAVGDDPDAAELAGISTKKVLVAVYTLAGIIAGLAAWVSIGRNGSISPSTVVTDFNLQAITATVIGGISLFGGRGSILGVLFGTLIVGIMSMGLNMMNADPQWKVLLTGVLIIAAVAVDQWIRKVSS